MNGFFFKETAISFLKYFFFSHNILTNEQNISESDNEIIKYKRDVKW